MNRITDVRALDGCRLWLRFADGIEGDLDLADLAGQGIFSAWDDRHFFESVHINASGALEWGDNIDLCPDSIYLRLTGKSAAEIFPGLATNTHA
ncbi:MAG: DUF2442 domain-containing protein [Acidobacteria bacterium]|nr:DUF2442 domain-containing protein [Acidobacteriota bacterium]